MSSVFDLVESGSREELLERLDGDGWDPKERDKHGRTALDLAVVLGRVESTNLLLEKGSDVNLANSSKYSPLHLGAVWGRLDCLRVLVSSGADHRLRTRNKEEARGVASRYGWTECVDYLDCVDAKFQLSQAVKQARDILADNDRITGKWNKDDKSKVTGLCSEKSTWMELNQQATLNDTLQQKRDFDERMQPYLTKINGEQ